MVTPISSYRAIRFPAIPPTETRNTEQRRARGSFEPFSLALPFHSSRFGLEARRLNFADWSAWIFSLSQRRYCSPFRGLSSSKPKSQNENQSTAPCSETYRSHGRTRRCVAYGRLINSTGFPRVESPVSHPHWPRRLPGP